MRVLLLTHSFNSLAQRLHLELAASGHELSVELDINDATTAEAVELFGPDVVVAPYLKRAIPEYVWRRVPCFVVHPGPPGDRGPSALDWAILRAEPRWGVTVLQATAELDGGPVWAAADFPMREARKSSLYRNEVTDGAVAAVLEALARFERGGAPLAAAADHGFLGWQPPMRQADRRVDWERDDTATVLRKLRSGDGQPGVEDELLGRRWRLFDACPEPRLAGRAGTLLARRHEAVCRATRDGAVWISQLQPVEPGRATFKRPATLALGTLADALPRSEPDVFAPPTGHSDITYEERGLVGFLRFDFYNGAMSTAQCRRLRAAYAAARRQPTRVIVLGGGSDFWSNGLHLHCIEAAASPADESWANINALDDLALDILQTGTHLTVAALQGNAGAGGVFLALAADAVHARRGVVLNPHYRNMGNLYGSEYWTYLLPRRLGARGPVLMQNRLPLDADGARRLGLIDGVAGPGRAEFAAHVQRVAEALAADEAFDQRLMAKRAQREHDERTRPLALYRAGELDRMRLNFYGFDPSYHVARHRFVHRTPHAWTPLYLARHRAGGGRRRRA